MSLDVFTQGNMKDMQQNTPSFHLITSNSTTLSGSPAHQIVFTSKSTTGIDELMMSKKKRICQVIMILIILKEKSKFWSYMIVGKVLATLQRHSGCLSEILALF